MDFINNANTIVGLVMGLIGFGGFIYGAITYLQKKAASPPKDKETISKQPSLPLPDITWTQWIELLAQGFIDMMDFILSLCWQEVFKSENISIEDVSLLIRIAGGSFTYLLGIGIGTLIVGFILGSLFSGLALSNASGAAGVAAFILVFAIVVMTYLYFVGIRIERKRQQQAIAYRQQQAQRVKQR